MFNKKTVFILGAGSSVGYGFPIGENLLTNLIDMSSVNRHVKDFKDDELKVFFSPSTRERRPVDLCHVVSPVESEINELKSIEYRFSDFLRELEIRRILLSDLKHENQQYIKNKIRHKDSRKLTSDNFVSINLKEDEKLEPFINELKEKSGFISRTTPMSISGEKIIASDMLDFNLALNTIDPINIDKFLLFHEKYQAIGKILIKFSIASKENPEKFKREHFTIAEGIEKNSIWYRYFVDAIINDCLPANQSSNGSNEALKPIDDNELSIVTFNYDVSLDYYLYDRLSRIPYFIDDKTGNNMAVEFYENHLDIFHVYGSLCNKNHIIKTDNQYRYGGYKFENFSRSLGGNNIISLFDKISENSQENKRFINNFLSFEEIEIMYFHKNSNGNEVRRKKIDKIREVIRNSETIVIIGFGFDKLNIKQIGLDQPVKAPKNIYYTNHSNNRYIDDLVDNHLLPIKSIRKRKHVTKKFNNAVEIFLSDLLHLD